jgi:hypothetical protein
MRKALTRLIEPRFIGLATLLFLLVLSVRYYLERTVCSDSTGNTGLDGPKGALTPCAYLWE